MDFQTETAFYVYFTTAYLNGDLSVTQNVMWELRNYLFVKYIVGNVQN